MCGSFDWFYRGDHLVGQMGYLHSFQDFSVEFLMIDSNAMDVARDKILWLKKGLGPPKMPYSTRK